MENSRRVAAFLQAKVSVPTWLLLIQNLLIGLVLFMSEMFYPDALGRLEARVWPLSLMIGAAISIYGAIKHSQKSIRIGSFLAVLSWVFGVIFYALSGLMFANAVVFGIPGIIFFVYLYLKFEHTSP